MFIFILIVDSKTLTAIKTKNLIARTEIINPNTHEVIRSLELNEHTEKESNIPLNTDPINGIRFKVNIRNPPSEEESLSLMQFNLLAHRTIPKYLLEPVNPIGTFSLSFDKSTFNISKTSNFNFIRVCFISDEYHHYVDVHKNKLDKVYSTPPIPIINWDTKKLLKWVVTSFKVLEVYEYRSELVGEVDPSFTPATNVRIVIKLEKKVIL